MDVKLLSIDRIGLSNRSTNALHRTGVHYVGDMLNCDKDSLMKIRNIGFKTVEEILNKIDEYKRISEQVGAEETIIVEGLSVPLDYDKWIQADSNKQLVIQWLKDKSIRIERLESLSSRAFNLLFFSGYSYVYQIAFKTEDELLRIKRMENNTAAEIIKVTNEFIKDNEEAFVSAMVKLSSSASVTEPKPLSIHDMLLMERYHDDILQYVKINDADIRSLGLSKRPLSRLLDKGCSRLSDVVFMTPSDLSMIPSMGVASVNEVMDKINEYLSENETRLKAYLEGDESVLWSDDSIRTMILKLYDEVRFGGLSFSDFTERLQLPESVTAERLKGIIGKLIAGNELEYVDYRCYRIYGRFEEYLDKCTDIDDRSREILRRRLNGETLEAVGNSVGITRERVRQIEKKEVEKVRNYYLNTTGMSLFDEDYYRYLYETYVFDREDGTKWLGIPSYVWRYLGLNNAKQGDRDLNEALKDTENLDVGLRIKIKNYLNRNKIFVDGMWVDKTRVALEQVVVRKFCTEDVSFEEFGRLYNSFLEQEEIPYDEKLYYTDSVLRTRENHLTNCKYLLWKLNKRLRYYDIEGRDFTELLETINIDSYENIEFSTAKLMRDYPEVMQKYDIRDHYELHNLLKKIVPEGNYNGFKCERMPNIVFGSFDRDSAVLDILIDNAPISKRDLAELISDEYGYDPDVIMGNYLQCIETYYHQGVYTTDQKVMSPENIRILKDSLTDDFYYITEIRNKYLQLIPDADVEEINPYNLKTMGFQVFSGYALQNYPSLESYFTDILTSENTADISPYRKRFTYVQAFNVVLMGLKRNLTIIEFAPNQIVTFRKLESSGVTLGQLHDFCDSVYDYVDNNEYFSIKSIKQTGFVSELFELGFSDWFYSNLLLSDDRFVNASMFGNLIFHKGTCSITIKSFLTSLIKEARCIDVYDLSNLITDVYGGALREPRETIYKIQDTEVYYDKDLDRFYANKDLYYKDIEEGGF